MKTGEMKVHSRTFRVTCDHKNKNNYAIISSQTLVQESTVTNINQGSKQVSSMEMMLEKPMSDILKGKHEGRRRSLVGHTGRRQCSYLENNLKPSLLLGKADKSAEYVTSIEVDVDDFSNDITFLKHPHNLNRSRRWEEIPGTLESCSVSTPHTSRASKRDGFRLETTYKLQPVANIAKKNPAASKEDAERARHIYFKPPRASSVYSSKFRPTKVYATPETEKPEGIKGTALPWVLCGSSGGRGSCKANVPKLHSPCSWDVETARASKKKGAFTGLEIDLGSTQRLTAISTQGAAPPTRMYPSVKHERRRVGWGTAGDGEWYVEGCRHDGKYKGPFWKVLDPTWPTYAGKRESQLRWVRSYEVFWRADRGRSWNSLGMFAGNSDTTSEVAHTLTGFQGGDFRCRYLRFVPTTGGENCVNGGALRVQVYGHPTQTREQQQQQQQHQSRHGGGEPLLQALLSSSSDEDGQAPCSGVEYTLTHPPSESASTSPSSPFVRDIFSTGNRKRDSYETRHFERWHREQMTVEFD
jgi:hypothetical protein